MQFVNPSVLWALGLLAVPIAIHLFQLRRYKTVYFSNIHFLRQVEQNTSKQRKVKEWLILASRLLLFAALILAFARPYIPAQNAREIAEDVLIYLDNSASTTAGNESFSPFERGKQIVQALLSQLPGHSRVALVTTENAGNPLFQSVEEARNLLSKAQPALRGNAQLSTSSSGKRTVFVVSDMQQGSLNLATMLGDTSSNYIIIPTVTNDKVSLSNATIDSAWIDAPFLMAGQRVTLYFRLRHYGQDRNDLNLEVLLNGKPEITLSSAIYGDTDTVLQCNLTQLKNGFNKVEINILNDNIPFDDAHNRAYAVPIANRVIEIFENKPSSLIATLFSDSEFSFRAIPAKTVDATQLATADLIILNGISRFTETQLSQLAESSQRANLLLIPHEKDNTAVNKLLLRLGAKTYDAIDTSTLQTQQVNVEDPFFAESFSGSLTEVYWPKVKKHFRLQGNTNQPTYLLMQLANSEALFLRYSVGGNNIFQLTVPLAETWSDIARHPVIVPLFIKSLMRGSNIGGYTGTIGTDMRFDLTTPRRSEKPASLSIGSWQQYPRQQRGGTSLSIVAGADLPKAGTYTLIDVPDTLGLLAFNLPKTESNMQRYTVEALQEWIDNAGAKNMSVLQAEAVNLAETLKNWQQGTQLWQLMLLLAICFFLIEVILLKLLK